VVPLEPSRERTRETSLVQSRERTWEPIRGHTSEHWSAPASASWHSLPEPLERGRASPHRQQLPETWCWDEQRWPSGSTTTSTQNQAKQQTSSEDAQYPATLVKLWYAMPGLQIGKEEGAESEMICGGESERCCSYTLPTVRKQVHSDVESAYVEF
jgi:hypothetical protein